MKNNLKLADFKRSLVSGNRICHQALYLWLDAGCGSHVVYLTGWTLNYEVPTFNPALDILSIVIRMWKVDGLKNVVQTGVGIQVPLA